MMAISPFVPIAILGVAAAAAAAASGSKSRRRKPEDEVIVFGDDEEEIIGGEPPPGEPPPEEPPPGLEPPAPLGELAPGQPHMPPFPGGPNDTGEAIEASELWLDFFDSVLASHGVHNFTARELTSARQGGGFYLRPPDEFARNLIKVAILAQKLRNRWGGPLVVSSAYRPWDNKSAHRVGNAIDFDLPGGMKTKANEHEFRLVAARLWKGEPQAAGLGFYSQPLGRVHLDVKSPVKGMRKRYWAAKHVKPILAELRGGAAARTLHQFAHAPQGGGRRRRTPGRLYGAQRRAEVEAIRLSLRSGVRRRVA